MTLNINTTDLPNHPGPMFVSDGDGRPEHMNATTFTLGMLMALHLGVDQITEANTAEVFERMNMWESGTGALRRNGDDGSDVFYTPEEIRQHVGLRVNQGWWTRTKFNANLTRVMRDRARETWWKAERPATVA